MEDLLFDSTVQLQYLPIDPAKAPYTFTIKLTDKTYTFTVKYNAQGDFFTLDLLTTTGDVLAFGDILRYGRPCFGSIEDERFPLPVILPLCLTEEGVDTITPDNLGSKVKLYLTERWAS